MFDAEHIRVWAGYAVAGTLASLTPGPAVLFVVSQGVWRGPSAALRANLAINTINSLNAILACFALALLSSLSILAFTVLKWVGAAYLIWLGGRALLGSFKPHDQAVADERPGRPFVDGLLVQGTNPKAFAFVLAIVPQFVDKAEPIVPQMLVLWLIGLVTEFSILGLYGLLAGYVRRYAGLPRMRAWLERLGGGMLITVGLAAAFFYRTP